MDNDAIILGIAMPSSVDCCAEFGVQSLLRITMSALMLRTMQVLLLHNDYTDSFPEQNTNRLSQKYACFFFRTVQVVLFKFYPCSPYY
jgi:hypothetical protein